MKTHALVLLSLAAAHSATAIPAIRPHVLSSRATRVPGAAARAVPSTLRGGAEPDSDATVLAKAAAGAAVETAALLAVLKGAAALPASASGALVVLNVLKRATVRGVPAAEWLAWFAVIFAPSAIGLALPRLLVAAIGRGGGAVDGLTSATRQLLMPTAVAGSPEWCVCARR